MAAFNLASKMAAKLSFQSFLSSLISTCKIPPSTLDDKDINCNAMWENLPCICMH